MFVYVVDSTQQSKTMMHALCTRSHDQNRGEEIVSELGGFYMYV